MPILTSINLDLSGKSCRPEDGMAFCTADSDKEDLMEQT